MKIPDYVAIDNKPGLARHTKSMAVINTDKQARTKYIIQRDKIRKEKQEIADLRKEVSELRQLVEKLLGTKI